ncbi:hypothetical protein C1H46_045624 [Malus baccata]|uniref:Uncharacterized protein n=1 Tax=Malus baccata TaxID=106549 RepID=A0A540K3N4_MALBA|nr:hypothetical protein C1H46_045624 [Malus baccata]
MVEEDGIVERSERLAGRSGSGVGSDSRWVDGSEVDSEWRPWSSLSENGGGEGGEGYGGSLRRRLVNKPSRVDSLDVEAMEIAGAGGHVIPHYFRFSSIFL